MVNLCTSKFVFDVKATLFNKSWCYQPFIVIIFKCLFKLNVVEIRMISEFLQQVKITEIKLMDIFIIQLL